MRSSSSTGWGSIENARARSCALVVATLLASSLAAADSLGRLGATIGLQQTDRSAWVFGPSAEVTVFGDLAIRGEAQLELGDLGDPFGPSNIRDGSGPHVNHVMFGPTWRPARHANFAVAAGAQAGVLVMHSTFAADHFAKQPAVGVFAQAGRRLGPVDVALQLRVDFSTPIAMAGPEGERVQTTSGRINLAFEVPIPGAAGRR
jgi:hypothetical protein